MTPGLWPKTLFTETEALEGEQVAEEMGQEGGVRILLEKC